jgi:hypothetical protein
MFFLQKFRLPQCGGYWPAALRAGRRLDSVKMLGRTLLTRGEIIVYSAGEVLKILRLREFAE